MSRVHCSALSLLLLAAGCGPAASEVRSAPTLASALAMLAPDARSRSPESSVSSPAPAAHAEPGRHVPGQLIVKFTGEALPAVEQARRAGGTPPRVGLASLDQLLGAYGVTRIEPMFPNYSAPVISGESSVGLSRIYLLHLTTGQDMELVAHAFGADPAVEYAEPNHLVHIRPLE